MAAIRGPINNCKFLWKIWNDFRVLQFNCTIAYVGFLLSREEEFGADYYRARAAEMLEKAQGAPTKATRIAYMNLANRWTDEAQRLEAAAREPGT